MALNLIEQPTWVFDVERHAIWWGNDAAVVFWKCDNVDDLISKDFSTDSDTVRQRLRLKIAATQSGETVTESWTVYPDGTPVSVTLRMRALKIDAEERDALFIEIIEIEPEDDYSHEHYRLIEAARYTSIMISYFSMQGDPIFRNPSAASIYGVTERSGKNAVLGPDDIPFSEQFCEPESGRAILEAVNEGQLRRDDFRMRTVAGERWHAVDARPVRDPVTGDDVVLVIEEDISSRYAAQQESEQSRRQLEEAIAVIPDGFVYYDAEDCLVLYNQRYLELYPGIAEHVRAGAHFEDLLRISVGVGDVSGSKEDPEAWIAKRMERHRDPSGVFEQKLADGRTLEISEYRTADGGSVGIRRDVTEIREAQRALAESEALLIDAVESLGDAFILTDSEDRIVIANARYLEYYASVADLIAPGVKFDEILWKSARRGIYPEAEGRVEEWVEDRLAMRKQTNVAFEQHLADGRWLRILERRTASGGIAGSRVDITEIKHAQQAAEEASRAKSEFLSSMSHELRTPLNSILGFAQVLAFDLRDIGTEKQKRAIDMITASGQHLLTLISDVLDLSRIESGRMEIRVEDVDVRPVVDDCLSVIENMGRRRNIRIDDRLPDEPMAVRADAIRFKQVLLNMLSNAVKYNRDNGTITLSTSSNIPGMLKIIISDEGAGIKPTQVDAVFAPFDRLGRESQSIEGTGVGLAISKTLIELMGGDIGFDTQAEGGTDFWITLPLAAKALDGALRHHSDSHSTGK